MNKHQKFIYSFLPLATFIIGIILPTPFHKGNNPVDNDTTMIASSDTINMKLTDGSIYNGSIIPGTSIRHGHGQLTTTDGTTYEGDWDYDKLQYGKKTTEHSTYSGNFDENLNKEGFGILEYSNTTIKKMQQKRRNNEIEKTYIGNWHNNKKNGIGRSIKNDGSMEFGVYKNGTFKKPDSTNYRIGGTVYGVDISHYQTNINWDQLALFCDKNGKVYEKEPSEKTYMQPIIFAYIKATEGATIKDNNYNIHTTEAERHGIRKGAYHFLRLSSSINDQVKNFTETAHWSPGDMPPALDIEALPEIEALGGDKLASIVLEWLNKIEKIMHVKPIIYTRDDIRNKYLMGEEFNKYNFWIARYNPVGPQRFDWHFWQMTEQGVVNGYDEGFIDINLYKGDFAAFEKFLTNCNRLPQD